jgi:predicted DNA-binding transcriptional regulator YafY
LKYDRLLRLTQLIDNIASVPGRNYQFYADMFEVHPRTIKRDINLLGEAGLAIETSAGIRFMNKIKLPEINFTHNEAISLMIALSELKRYINFDGQLDQVKDKIAEIIPNNLLKIVEKIEERVGIYHGTDNVALRSSDQLNPLISCLIDNRKISIKYNSRNSNNINWRKVSPYGLFFRRRAWYLVAYCELRDEIRTFRLNRIIEWEHHRQYFKLPCDFNLDNYVMKSWEVMRGDPAKIKVIFSARVSDLIMEAVFHKEEVKEYLDDGSVVYKIEVKGWKEVFLWILSYGSDAEIINPEWLRKKAEEEAEKMLKNYQN